MGDFRKTKLLSARISLSTISNTCAIFIKNWPFEKTLIHIFNQWNILIIMAQIWSYKLWLKSNLKVKLIHTLCFCFKTKCQDMQNVLEKILWKSSNVYGLVATKEMCLEVEKGLTEVRSSKKKLWFFLTTNKTKMD